MRRKKNVTTWDNREIGDLRLSVRAINALTNAGIARVGEICERSEPDLESLRGMGRKSACEVRHAVELVGMKLRGG